MRQMFLVLASLILTRLAAASETSTIHCFYEDGGYDDETIDIIIDENNCISAIDYVSYQGEVGPFVKIDEHTFFYTTEQLIIKTIAKVEPDFRLVKLEIFYKESGARLGKTREFVCE